MDPEPLPQAVDCEHLTDALRRHGVLGDGRVSHVAVEHSRATILSQIIRLRLTYKGAAPDAPGSVIFKTGLRDRDDWSGGRQEVAFYARVAPAMPGHLVPRCFEGHLDEETKTWHLVLEDLTDSHVIATVWPLPPTPCGGMIRALVNP